VVPSKSNSFIPKKKKNENFTFVEKRFYIDVTGEQNIYGTFKRYLKRNYESNRSGTC
jgi:hypothetical protein